MARQTRTGQWKAMSSSGISWMPYSCFNRSDAVMKSWRRDWEVCWGVPERFTQWLKVMLT